VWDRDLLPGYAHHWRRYQKISTERLRVLFSRACLLTPIYTIVSNSFLKSNTLTAIKYLSRRRKIYFVSNSRLVSARNKRFASRQFTSSATRRIHLDPNHNFQRNRSWHSNKFPRPVRRSLLLPSSSGDKFPGSTTFDAAPGKIVPANCGRLLRRLQRILSFPWIAFHA